MCGGLYLLISSKFCNTPLSLCLWAGSAEIQRGCAIVSWAGLRSILARLNSTSDEYSNWGRDQGEAGEGPGEASLSLSNWAGFIWATV